MSETLWSPLLSKLLPMHPFCIRSCHKLHFDYSATSTCYFCFVFDLFVGKVSESTGLLIKRLHIWILAGEFSSPELTLCADSYWSGVCSTPMLLQWLIKDPGHSAKKSTGGKLHLKTHTPLTQQSWNWLTMLLSRHSVGTYLEMSSRTTCQGTFGHSRLSSLSHRGLILA